MLAFFLFSWDWSLTELSSFSVRISKPVLSVVGSKLVLGKDFQVLCHSENGSLPIIYTLFRLNSQSETRQVTSPGEWAIFNVSALYNASDINKLVCQARNSRHEPVMTNTLSYLTLIGMLAAKALGKKMKIIFVQQELCLQNLCPCRC